MATRKFLGNGTTVLDELARGILEQSAKHDPTVPIPGVGPIYDGVRNQIASEIGSNTPESERKNTTININFNFNCKDGSAAPDLSTITPDQLAGIIKIALDKTKNI